MPYNVVPSTIRAAANQGGWQADCRIINDQALMTYGRKTDIYVRGQAGGSWMPDSVPALNGSMFPQALSFNRRQSIGSVVVATTDWWLRNAALQGIYFSQQASPQNPHQIVDLRLGTIIYHILTEHTNCTKATPGGWVNIDRLDTVNSTSVNVYTVRQSNSIWDVLKKIADNEFYVRYFTKQDYFVYEPHPQFRDSIPDPVLNIVPAMIIGQPEITFRNDVQTDQVQLYALSDTGVIFTANYPTNVGTEGRRQKFTNIRCNEQIRVNLLAERAFKFLNRDYSVRLSLPGIWGAYLEMYDRVSLSYTGTSINGVTVDWTEKKFWIDSITINIQSDTIATTELVLDEETL